MRETRLAMAKLYLAGDEKYKRKHAGFKKYVDEFAGKLEEQHHEPEKKQSFAQKLVSKAAPVKKEEKPGEE